MEELIEWAIAAFMSNPEADDTALIDLLVPGFPRGHATRAVTFLPIAFGRRILRELGTAAPDTFLLDGHERPFASEPLYGLAEARAALAGREEIGRIGLRSAEVNAVNNALQAGHDAGELVLSPPVLMALEGPTDGGVTAASMLATFLAAHGSTLAGEARVFPFTLTSNEVNGQVDVMISAPVLGERQIVESFAWFGTITDGRARAMEKFARGSLHALLASLDGRPDDDQVEWETWGDFRVCLGALLRDWSDEVDVDFAPFIDEIKRRLLAANLSREVHWFRTFVAVGKDEIFGHDALLDNGPWAPGEELVTGWPWPRAERPYALRHFFVLVPAGG